MVNSMQVGITGKMIEDQPLLRHPKSEAMFLGSGSLMRGRFPAQKTLMAGIARRTRFMRNVLNPKLKLLVVHSLRKIVVPNYALFLS